jgi:hypothetical protein
MATWRLLCGTWASSRLPRSDRERRRSSKGSGDWPSAST